MPKTFREMTDDELIEEAKSCHSAVYEVDCYSSRDARVELKQLELFDYSETWVCGFRFMDFYAPVDRSRYRAVGGIRIGRII